jgi:hypothetical protein
MAKKLGDIIATLPAQRRARFEGRAMILATFKVLRKVVDASRRHATVFLTLVQHMTTF